MPSKKNKKKKRSSVKAQNLAPQLKKKRAQSKLWKFIFTGFKKRTSSLHPRMKIARKTLSKRTIGIKSNKKIHLTIIGLVVLIAIGLSLSPFQDYFKASILSVKQKNAVVTSARARLGVPYQLGGQGPGSYDCSGLTGAIMKEALNINLPRTSRDQYSVGRDIPFANIGIGDLVFFNTYGSGISHVGVITEVRSGKAKMVNANSYTGKVEEEWVEGYWLEVYIGAREITEATKDVSAPSEPDSTYIPPPKTTSGNQYNNYFPPSERADPRLKVGAATIEENNSSTRIINDISLESETPIINNYQLPINNSTPTPKVTATTTPTPLLTINPNLLPQDLAVPTSPSPTSSPPSSSSLSSPFSDVSKNDRSYNAIKELVDANIISGYSDGTFRPGDPVTRAELLKMVYKVTVRAVASGDPQLNASSFTDISNHPLSKYITSAYNDGIIKGYPDKTFRPQNSVTRAEGAKIILKAFGVDGETPRREYTDMDETHELAEYLGYLTNHRLLRVVNSMVNPGKSLTRSEVVVILASLLD